MKNFFRKLHLWLSVPFGVVITIICFTGAMLVFESEITALCISDITTVAPGEKALPLDKLVEKVKPFLGEGVKVGSVAVSSSPSKAYKVNLSKPHRAAVYVNQYTGEVLGYYERLPFFDVMRRMHRWLMDTRPGDGGIYWGKMIVGVSTLAFALILFTGLIAWWPRNRKMLKNRVQIVASKGVNRFWHDLHVAGGFYALLFLLAMSLTGLTWFFGLQNNNFKFAGTANHVQNYDKIVAEMNGAQKTGSSRGECIGDCSSCDGVPCGKNPAPVQADAITSATSQADATTGATVNADAVTAATAQADASTGATVGADAVTAATAKSAPAQNADYSKWQLALDKVTAYVKDYSEITVSDGAVSVASDGMGNQRAIDIYRFDKQTGDIISPLLYDEMPLDFKTAGWIRTLHVGSWGGVFSKVLYFLAALLGATLPLTGYYLWIRRICLKKKNKKQ